MRVLLLIAFIIALTMAGKPDANGCTGEINLHDIIDSPPTLVKEVLNGKKYTIDYDGRKFYIIKVRGTAEEMGEAYGNLLQQELATMQKEFFEWAENFVETNVSVVAQRPAWLRKMIGKSAVSVAKQLLDINYFITKKYTPQRWDDEFKGIGKGSGISANTWRRINLIPELLKASCSVGGWWGNATETGSLIQLRALDWEAHAPISKFPMVAVYHPTEKGSVPFANIAWVGFVGSLTGMSSAGIGVSERLRGGAADTMTRFGKPWTYALRDVLQFSQNLDDALNNLNQTDRTCSIYLGIGSQRDNTYRIIEYAETEFRVYNDGNWKNDPAHPRMPGMIWKAYNDGANCFASVFSPHYGSITAEMVFREAAGKGETGDSQVVVMDFYHNTIYCQYPHPVTQAPGFQRPSVKINMEPLFNGPW